MLRALWDEACTSVRAVEDQQLFEPWLECLRFHSATDRSIVLAAPNRLYVDWIRENLHAVLLRHLEAKAGHPIALSYELDPLLSVAAKPVVDVDATPVIDPEPTFRLNQRKTFDTFVVGNGNQFANAACRNVAEQPACNYNPLFLFGGVGLGKTHLLQAVGNRIRERDPSAHVLYMSAEDFTNELIGAIQKKRMDEFRDRFRRRCDVLLVDDIQVLATRERTQEEFVHTFNALHADGKQIVVSGDRYPKDIAGLEDRLRSRFDWGLVVDIQAPDMETRVAILQRRALEEGATLPRDVAFFIAQRCDGNVRELEGLLCRVVAFAGFHKEPITLDGARRWLSAIRPNEAPGHNVDHIVDQVARHYRVKSTDIRGKRRTKEIVEPRQLAMYFARQGTDLSYPELGRHFERDHTTVLYAVEKVECQRRADPAFELRVDGIGRSLGLKKKG